MDLLKRIPVKYRGELHDVRLINFSVPIEEVFDKVPPQIRVRNFDGRAIISMVDVKLKNMRPVVMPILRFAYRHIAFRLLVDDSDFNGGENKGIYFMKAFTNKKLIVTGGKWLTDYHLSAAKIKESGKEVTVKQGTDRIKYRIDNQPITADVTLKQIVGAIDRAYSVLGKDLRVTEIQREKWPIQQVNCYGLENTFFKDVKLEGAFRVFETIYYEWKPPRRVNTER